MRTWGLLAAIAVLAVAGTAPRLVRGPPPKAPSTPALTASIQGAVRQPGSYILPWGARLADLIAAAGGTTTDAALELLNLAAPVGEASQWMVPRLNTPSGDTRTSLNSATRQELERLPGVGPVMAERIASARPFHDIEELIRVKGIGKATMERLRPLIAP